MSGHANPRYGGVDSCWEIFWEGESERGRESREWEREIELLGVDFCSWYKRIKSRFCYISVSLI